jgi:hypothetical protein
MSKAKSAVAGNKFQEYKVFDLEMRQPSFSQHVQTCQTLAILFSPICSSNMRSYQTEQLSTSHVTHGTGSTRAAATYGC